MDIKILESLRGKPVNILKADGFKLSGYIVSIIGESVEFETQQKVGYFDATEILEISERNRNATEEECVYCGAIFYRKTATQKCKICGK